MTIVPLSPPSSQPESASRAAIFLACAIALLALIGALRATDSWAEFFAHPLVAADITLKGAEFFRIMLVVCAMTAVGGTLLITRFRDRSAAIELARERGSARQTLYGLLGLVMLGFALRAVRINESLWYDEIASWRTYNGGTQSFGAVIGAFLDPINHTLHTLLNRFSVQGLVGEVGLEVAFRTPALLFSLATIPVMFGLARDVSGEGVGWIAAALAATAPVCVLEGVEARGYAQMIFFSAASTWSLIAAFRSTNPLLWLLYGLCCALGVWSQFVTAWVAIGHGAWLAWSWLCVREDRSRCVQGAAALMLAGVISITLHAPMIPGLLAWRDNFVAQRPDQPRILGNEGLHALLQLGGSWTWSAAVVGLGLFASGLIAMSRRRASEAHRVSLRDAMALSFVGMALMLVAVAVSGTWLYARFMLFVMPGALLAISLGIHAAWLKRRALGIAAMITLVVAGLVDIVSLPAKQPLRDAVEFVQTRFLEGDRVVAVGLAHDVLSIYGLELNIADSFMFGRDLPEKLDAIKPRWVIIEYPLHVPADRYETLASRGYREIARFDGWADWGHGDVLIYSK